MTKKSILLGATAFAVWLPISPAMAQNFDDGEIIVTARKQQESILKVPVVATVLGAAQLERAQIKDLVDIARKAPGLQIGAAPTETGAQISMRGYGTTALDPGIDQSVSLNLDGMQITQGMAYAVGFFDMAQVEVLKGPQALFFGKASPAGVVSIRTADPGDEFELIARSGMEAVADEWRNELIISGPITDTLGVRLAGLYGDFGGYFKNTGTPRPGTGALKMPDRFGANKTIFLRGTVLFEPASSFSARLKLNYTRDRQRGTQPGQLDGCNEGTFNYLQNTLGLPIPSFFSEAEDCRVDRSLNMVGMHPSAFPSWDFLKGGEPASHTSQKFGTLELNYDVTPDVTLTSLTGYYKLVADVDFNCFHSGGSGPSCGTQKHLERREFTQEVRAVSDFAGPLNFSVGGFYQDGEITDEGRLYGNTALGISPVLFDGTHDIDIKALSFFGQLRYQVVPELELAGGVRWTHEKRMNSPTTVDIFGLYAPGSTVSFPNGPLGTPGRVMVDEVAQPKLNSKTWSPEFTITYTPTNNLTIFASVKQAYKSGSYNVVQPINPGQDRSFGDEKIRGGEIGIKTRLADQQVNFNMAAYYYKVNDMQVGVSLPFENGLPSIITLNAGSAKIYGIEADFNFRPYDVPGLEVFAAVNWNRGRFSDFENAPCLGGQSFEEGCTLAPVLVNDSFPSYTDPNVFNGAPFRYSATDLTGEPLTRAPEWTGNIGAFYQMPVGNDLSLGIGADAQYSSKFLGLLGLDERLYQGSYAKLNANVSLSGPNDAWEISFIGNNLTNKLIKTTSSSANYAGGVFFPGSIFGGPADGPGGDDEVWGYYDRGRELWLRLTLRPTAFNR